MTLNKLVLDIHGVTEKDYRNWCREVHKAAYKASTKAEFFLRIQDGRLVKDQDGKLIKKRRGGESK